MFFLLFFFLYQVAKTLGLSAELIGTAHRVAGAGLEKLTSRDSVAISLARMFLSEVRERKISAGKYLLSRDVNIVCAFSMMRPD